MERVRNKRHRLIFYGLWLLLGIVQAGLTELQDDEAYYWLYSQFLDWGYFDHPPMIGLLIKAGDLILPGELGVRFFPLILNVLSLLLIEGLTRKKDPLLFYGIAMSIAVLQISGFIAVPDIPLIFFTALFFHVYQRFLYGRSWLNVFLLGLTVAMLLYSKYHAVLIVLFVLLSNVKLLRDYRVYIAGLVALLLFSPHIYWQYQHDFVSFRYHLFESNVNSYKFSFTTDYIIGQLLLPGPIAGFILLPAAFIYRSGSTIERSLKFTLIGIYVFFLLSSFRGRVEGNWTSPALVPLMILSHQYLVDKTAWRQMLYRLLPFTLILVLFARIVMIADILPVKEIKSRYHAWKHWPSEMRQKTNNLPIVFSNSYQRASKYWFYTGQPSYSQNWYRERRNSFNFWPIEDSMLGKPVYFLDKYDLSRFPDSLNTPIGWIGYRYDSSFASFARIQFRTTPELHSASNTAIVFPAEAMIPENYKAFILSSTRMADSIRVGIFNKQGWLRDVFLPVSLNSLCVNPQIEVNLGRLQKGSYYLRFTIQAGKYNATHNSEKITLKVK